MSRPDCEHWRDNGSGVSGDCAIGKLRRPTFGACAHCLGKADEFRVPVDEAAQVAARDAEGRYITRLPVCLACPTDCGVVGAMTPCKRKRTLMSDTAVCPAGRWAGS